MIYLDNAATTGKKPESVIAAVNNTLKFYSANPGRSGHKLSVAAAEKIYGTRLKCCEFFGADSPEQVIFTANCTEAINVVLKGILKAGDKVLTSDIEHNAVMRPLTKIGAKLNTFSVSLKNDDETLENFKNSLSDDIKLVIVTAASNVCGKTLPLEKMGKILSDKNILFAVDGAQGGGVLPIDMKKMKIDFLCIAAHKGLYAATGTGFLIARKDIPNTLIEGGTGTNSLDFLQPDTLPEKFESGTVNLCGIVSVSKGIDFVKARGENLYLHEQNLIKTLYENLKDVDGIVLYTPYPREYLYAPVLSLNVEGVSSQIVAEILDKNNIAVRAGLHCAPTAHTKLGTQESGTVRISPSVFNNRYEIEKTVNLLKKIAKNRKKYVE